MFSSMKDPIKSFLTGKRREGISIVESLIMVLVLVVTLGATMQTIFWSLKLQSSSREQIGAYTFINSWMEAFETIPPDDVTGKDDAVIRAMVEDRLGRPKIPYKYEMDLQEGDNVGIHTLVLEVWPSSSENSLVMARNFNKFSSSPAPDNSEYERR